MNKATSKQGTDRRTFLKHALAAGGAAAFPAIIPSSALGLDGAVAPSNRLVGIAIGMGGRGCPHPRGRVASPFAAAGQRIALRRVDGSEIRPLSAKSSIPSTTSNEPMESR